MISNFKLKIYGYAETFPELFDTLSNLFFYETEPQNNRKKSFKNDFIRIYKAKIAATEKENKQKGIKKKKVDVKKGIPAMEIHIIDEFLSQFLLDGDGGSKVGQNSLEARILNFFI